MSTYECLSDAPLPYAFGGKVSGKIPCKHDWQPIADSALILGDFECSICHEIGHLCTNCKGTGWTPSDHPKWLNPCHRCGPRGIVEGIVP